MNRRRPSFVARTGLVVAGVAALSSCSATTTSSNVVAQVDDSVLTFDDLKTQAEDGSAFANGNAVRAETSSWVQTQLAAKSGIDKVYQTALPDLGVMCLDVMLAPEESEAAVDALMTQVDANGWDATAAAYTDSTQQPTEAPCRPASSLDPASLEVLGDGTPGEVIRVADPVIGYAVLRIRPFEKLDKTEFIGILNQISPEAAAKATATAADVDVYVNPRVGTFSPANLAVEPLGAPPVELAATTPAG